MIKPSPSGRYFTDEWGKPVFWLGDTQWELFRLFTPEGASPILKDRQAKGFNAILVMLMGVDMTRFGQKDQVPYANLEGERPWLDDDPEKPNEKYFRHIDPIIRLGAKTGQVFVVGVYHQWHLETITVQKARAWAKWVANRYRDVPDLIWCMYPKATDEYKPVCRELAAGLREGDGGKHLISVHPDPSVASSSFMHDEEWLAFNMIQTCVDYDRIHEAVTADYRRTPVKPVVMAEGGYEGVEFEKLQTPHHIRKQAWWTQLGGGYHVYGHNEAWMFPAQWKKWLDSPGSRHLKVFRDVMTSLDGWWDMVPDQSLFASGTGSGYALNAAVRSPSGDMFLAYLSEPCTAIIRPGALIGGKQVTATWIDPVAGERTDAGSFPANAAQSFATPREWGDAILHLKGE